MITPPPIPKKAEAQPLRQPARKRRKSDKTDILKYKKQVFGLFVKEHGVTDFLHSLWGYLTLSSPYLLLGLFLSGVVHNFVNVNFVKRHLKKGVGSVVKAALFGIPLPLCSCAVIPTAIMLRKNGAGNGATSSFLISTPESGVDSIAMTYAMMDIPMTIMRPIAAFFSSVGAGIAQLAFNSYELPPDAIPEEKKGCCKKIGAAPVSKVRQVLRFSFVSLIDDISLWLGIGLFLGAIINWLVPADGFSGMTGFGGRMALLGVGIPFYICASATTPIAASLILKGMSPGMALIILLVGPATNVSNIMVVQKYIGKKGVVINIISIALVALLFSYIVDFFYYYLAWPQDFNIGHVHHHAKGSSWIEVLSAIILTALIVKGIVVTQIRPLWQKSKSCA